MTDRLLALPEGYGDLLRQLRERIAGAQMHAALAVNRELVLLYWHLGREILTRQQQQGWGAKIIDRLSRDLQHEFPDQKGFSSRNLKYMRAFAETWPDEALVQGVLAQITWYHNLALLEKVGEPGARLWYAQQAFQYGWSRNVLVHQIERGLYARQGRALTNFDQALPPATSDLARSLLKDPYTFDFLTIGDDARERDLENALTQYIRDFLLELGVGFAFVGSQYHIEVGSQDFYLDMLFYHLKLRCYVAIDLKVGEFTPEHAGKMNFYLSAIDDQLRHRDDEPSIGLILCKTKNQVVVEYALRDVRKPIGIAEYQITQALPDHLQGSLPTIEELEATLEAPDQADDDKS